MAFLSKHVFLHMEGIFIAVSFLTKDGYEGNEAQYVFDFCNVSWFQAKAHKAEWYPRVAGAQC